MPPPGHEYVGSPQHCRLCWLWHNNPLYRQRWEDRAKGETTTQSIVVRSLPCLSLREELRLEGCDTCTGSTKIKVFRCEIHNQCTLGKQLPNTTACCTTCSDYNPKTTESST